MITAIQLKGTIFQVTEVILDVIRIIKKILIRVKGYTGDAINEICISSLNNPSGF